jgi:hypothetical protein
MDTLVVIFVSNLKTMIIYFFMPYIAKIVWRIVAISFASMDKAY